MATDGTQAAAQNAQLAASQANMAANLANMTAENGAMSQQLQALEDENRSLQQLVQVRYTPSRPVSPAPAAICVPVVPKPGLERPR